jgi:hypothetical protein
LLVGERPPSGDSSELFVNQGDGSFKAAANYGAPANYAGNLVAADFDGDGRLDLVSQANSDPEVDSPDRARPTSSRSSPGAAIAVSTAR